MQKQRLKQKQSLQLSPKQIQFLSLLQIPVMSLQKRIENELESNPALEESNEDEESEDEVWEKSSYSKGSEEKTKPVIEERELSLQEHLLIQLPLLNLNEEEYFLSEFVIGCLDDNGFLIRSMYAISDDLLFKQNITIDENTLLSILKTVQSLEPIGVGARDLKECLILQLKDKEKSESTTLAIEILENHYTAFTSKNFEKLLIKYSVSEEILKLVYQEVTKLNPKPGASFANREEGISFITPDFLLTIQDEELQLQLNNANKKLLKTSAYYKNMLADLKNGKDKEAIAFLQQKIENADWFTQALQQREHTLLSTMSCILELQNDFFITGDEKQLHPMKLLDVAQKVNLDVSTISRVTNSKYIDTPFGTFLLKEFFSESYSKEDGTTVSTKVIKTSVKEIIETEDKKSPLTDEQISHKLEEEGYHVARRTVAKYRGQLNFSTAKLRREL